MDKKKNIENKIKETFERQNKTAPSDLWNKLSDSLPDSKSDKHIEEKIKNVFEKTDQSAPPFVWDNVNKQLNIDKVWNKINKELDRKPVIYWRNIASVILFLLLISAGVYRYNKGVEDKALAESLMDQTSTDNKTVLAKTSSLKDVKEKNGNNSILHEKAVISGNKNSNKEIPFKKNNRSKSVVNAIAQKNIKTISTNQNNVTELNYQFVAETDLVANDSDSIEPVLPVNLNSIISYPIFINNQEPDIAVVLNDIAPIENNTSIKQKRVEIGITCSYNNTWILNSETQQAFEANSLTRTSLAFAASYGVVAAYNISKNSALSTELYINSRSQQKYGEFIEGKYYDHTLQFNYTKLTLLYQLNLNQSAQRRIPSKFTFKTGIYGSYLRNFTHVYNQSIDVQQNKYTKNDYGLKFAIGQEKKINDLIIGYGINSEYGLNNNFAGNGFMPAAFDVTKNALVGPYFCLKYSF